MCVTKLTADLKRYIVDKLHPPTAKAKQAPFERKLQDGCSSPSKFDKLVIHLVEITPTSEEEVLVGITVFNTTGRLQVQGKRIEDWNTHEFLVLLKCVNKLRLRANAEFKSNFTRRTYLF